jgi:hypothetical protein
MPFPLTARRLLLAVAIAPAALGAIPALADDIAPLVPGQQMVLASYYELSRTGCRALSPPRVTITKPAALGKVIVVRTEGLVNTSLQQCAVRTMNLPIMQVVYQADKPGFDTMAWSVQYQARVGYHGEMPRMEYGHARLLIKPASAKPAPAQPAIPVPPPPAPAQ